MSTSTLTATTGSDLRGGRLLLAAVVVTGLAFAAEAVASVFVDAHIEYHSLNSVLNVALLVASAGLALARKAAVGRAGVVGGWATALMALLAAAGGVWAVLVEGFTAGESPGVVEGIAHTAVLASILFLVPLGIGLRRVDGVSGLVIAASSACLVVMVIAGFDQPAMFLAPEAALGLGWLLLSRALPVGSVR